MVAKVIVRVFHKVARVLICSCKGVLAGGYMGSLELREVTRAW